MDDDSERIANIQKAVERASDYDAVYVEPQIVIEAFEGNVVWEGWVEIFDLRGHHAARRAYGWQDGERIVAVLGIPPVDSAQTAVRAAIAGARRDERA
jgi:hypothetical protein